MMLDTTRFPLVFMREDDIHPAEGSPEMSIEALLDRGDAFVLLTDHLPGDHAEESHEELKKKALFFKRNKARMRALCKGLVLILGDRTIAAPVRLAAQGAGKALGLPVAFVQTEGEATERASQLLAT